MMAAIMDNRIFYRVNLAEWVYGTIAKQRQGASWQSAWVETYREIGGVAITTGKKACPMLAAKTLYEYGRIKDGGLPFRSSDIPELWSQSRNGTYAILATGLLRTSPHLSKASLWREVQRAVRRKVGEEPARTNQGGVSLAYQLWRLGLIVDGPE